MAVADTPNILETMASNNQVAHSKSILKVILFARTHGHELSPIGGVNSRRIRISLMGM